MPTITRCDDRRARQDRTGVAGSPGQRRHQQHDQHDVRHESRAEGEARRGRPCLVTHPVDRERHEDEAAHHTDDRRKSTRPGGHVAPRRPRQTARRDERLGQRPSGARHQEQSRHERQELGCCRLVLRGSHLLGELAADAPGIADRIGVDMARHQADESDAEQEERHEEQEQAKRDRAAEHRSRRHPVAFVDQEAGIDERVVLAHPGRPRRRRLRPLGGRRLPSRHTARGNVEHLGRFDSRRLLIVSRHGSLRGAARSPLRTRTRGCGPCGR